MRYRPLGRTGVFVSELCLGTMTFGGKGGFWPLIGRLGQDDVTSIVGRAIEAGVNFIDTADVYSEGESERLVGGALRQLNVKRSDVIVATKVRGRVGAGPNDIGLSRHHILDSVERSLERLQLDYIDLYQIHGDDTATPLEETVRALDHLVGRGLVRYIGCSNLSAWRIMKALGLQRQHNYARFETVQAYYTVASRDLERDILPMVNEEGLGLMVWSPLAGGLLSGKFARQGAIPNDARRTSFDFPPVDRERAFAIVDAMTEMAKARGVSVARIALAWLLHQRGVMSVIVGAKTIAQLDDNLAASGLMLTPEELAALETLGAPVPEYPQWMIARQWVDRLPKNYA
jgi:aryl-alcohol dehydrogenase-like predicted oxidoreductase